MAKTGNVRGDLVSGESGAPEIAQILSLATGTLTKQTSGKSVFAAGTTALGFGGITAAQLVYIKAVDNITKADKVITGVFSPGAVVISAFTSYLMINSAGPTCTGISVVVTGTDAEIEWVILG